MNVMTKQQIQSRAFELEEFLDYSHEHNTSIVASAEAELCQLYGTLQKMNQLEADNG